MSSLTRLIGLSVIIFLFFLISALAAQGWLQRQYVRVQKEATDTRRQQFRAASEITRRQGEQWTPAHLQNIAQLIDAQVSLLSKDKALPPKDRGWITIRESLPHTGPTSQYDAIISFQLPQTARLSLIHGRTWGMLLILALAVMLVFVLLGLFFTRRPDKGGSRPPWARARTEMSSLEQMAKTSNERGTELAHERDNRLRIEKDLNLTQRLQTQALEEKIRLGRDLHDDVIQSLYAVGLTIEAARADLQKTPDQADERLQQCLDGLNASIRDVRSYITGLSPEKLRRLNFANAVELFGRELGAGRRVSWDTTIDEDAATALTFEQTTEALQITREAISNALRHGQSDAITVRLHRNDAEVGLLIQDNGHGFDQSKQADDGHGLTNMQARAQQIGASLRIDSKPDEGTRIVITFPVTPLT